MNREPQENASLYVIKAQRTFAHRQTDAHMIVHKNRK